MSQENSRFASMLNVNGTTYAYYPVSAVAGSEQLPYSLTVLLENVLRNAETPEAAEELAAATRSEVVQVIGTKFVLYRPSHKKDKKDKIVLVKDSRKKPVV